MESLTRGKSRRRSPRPMALAASHLLSMTTTARRAPSVPSVFFSAPSFSPRGAAGAARGAFKSINFKHIFSFIFLCTLIPFFIAVDWGRWFNLSYTMSTLLFIFCLKNKIIFINKVRNLISLQFFEKKKIYLGIILFIICFSWNPKAIYRDDIGSIPIYRASVKVFKIINNSIN